MDSDFIEVCVENVIRTTTEDHFRLDLIEVGGERGIHIIIRTNAAAVIVTKCKNETKNSRPDLYELILRTMEVSGLRILYVELDRIEGKTFYANLVYIDNETGEISKMDCRPTDAVALALTLSPPLSIRVNKKIFEQADIKMRMNPPHRHKRLEQAPQPKKIAREHLPSGTLSKKN